MPPNGTAYLVECQNLLYPTEQYDVSYTFYNLTHDC